MAAYKDITKIGDGGFGEVWKCKRESDGKLFAKKRLTTADAGAVARFGREVRLLASLDHPNVVKVQGKRLESEPYFYVMPVYRSALTGHLAQLAGDFDRIDAIFGQILDGLEYSHSQGVVHRDLKAANVLMNDDSDVVISDFGLGRRFNASTTRQTLTGYGLGSPLYMPPEQLTDAKDADERSDIFSLGRLLTEMWLGHLSMAQDLSSIPGGVRRIIEKCTQHSPDDRYQTVSDVKSAWEQYRQIRGESDNAKSLRKLLAKAQAGNLSDPAEIQLLFDQLAEQSDDFLHDAIIAIDPSILEAADAKNVDSIKQLLIRFADFTSQQGYGYDYTDKIGTAAVRFTNACPDPVVASHLAACCAHVGLRHNRWYVMESFAKFADKIGDCDFVDGVVKLLEGLPENELKRLGRYVDMAKVHPTLRTLLGG
ncbi:serine/threonine-protein kinase [Rhodopirellula sp. SWK7]|uniref:serine/threonine-protein kinase n=1 Tax=Rhodopirellula sp. SWK7 TaxID=595460 RepID=UPI0002C0100B|nr:serine/threonine-protein kinase [Rhodopirellula sp. SWK7]EMI41695.1 serine/threonine protein kinase [Rhodopirellula sp. SWK7]